MTRSQISRFTRPPKVHSPIWRFGVHYLSGWQPRGIAHSTGSGRFAEEQRGGIWLLLRDRVPLPLREVAFCVFEGSGGGGGADALDGRVP